MAKYRRINREDRIRIRAFLDAGVKKNEIAKRLGLHRATVYREISRGKGRRVYNPDRAEKRANELFSSCRRHKKIQGKLKLWIISKLKQQWSPEQICGRLRLEKSNHQISHETIYRFIEADYKSGGKLYELLRRQKIKGRRRRFPRLDRRLAGLPIRLRPKVAESRKRIGDWERDTMLVKGRKAILVCVDRKSRFAVLAKMKSKESWTSYVTTLSALAGKPIFTLTNDRGTEFRDDLRMAGVGMYPWELKSRPTIPVFYCDPYAPRQRGTVENTIGLLRQYLPKKTEFIKIKSKALTKYQDKLNLRPRKILAWKTPHEVFYGEIVALAL